MMKSLGGRFLIVAVLTLFMFIPLFFASAVIEERRGLSKSSIETVGAEWGGAQVLRGPQLMIPVRKRILVNVLRPKVDPDTGEVLHDPETGEELSEQVASERFEGTDPIYVYPDQFQLNWAAEVQIRKRGIFEVPVYTSTLQSQFNFDVSDAEVLLIKGQEIVWDKAELRLRLRSNHGLRGQAELMGDTQPLLLEPLAKGQGIRALVGDPRKIGAFDLKLGLNGAELLRVLPVGRHSEVTISGDWPHPSFGGAYLPDQRTVSDEGFSATWQIPHLARNLSLQSRVDVLRGNLRDSETLAFGVSLLQPNDFYQKAFRAARYGILFIALTFLTILLVEKAGSRPVHAVQYLLVGLAQSLFVLMMVAYAELIGFTWAYALSAGAVISLLTLYGWLGLKMGKRTTVLAAVLLVVYLSLYLILNSTDYALLAGSMLAFLALAVTMFATRNEDWFSTQASPKPAQPKGGEQPSEPGPK